MIGLPNDTLLDARLDGLRYATVGLGKWVDEVKDEVAKLRAALADARRAHEGAVREVEAYSKALAEAAPDLCPTGGSLDPAAPVIDPMDADLWVIGELGKAWRASRATVVP